MSRRGRGDATMEGFRKIPGGIVLGRCGKGVMETGKRGSKPTWKKKTFQERGRGSLKYWGISVVISYWGRREKMYIGLLLITRVDISSLDTPAAYGKVGRDNIDMWPNKNREQGLLLVRLYSL